MRPWKLGNLIKMFLDGHHLLRLPFSSTRVPTTRILSSIRRTSTIEVRYQGHRNNFPDTHGLKSQCSTLNAQPSVTGFWLCAMVQPFMVFWILENK